MGRPQPSPLALAIKTTLSSLHQAGELNRRQRHPDLGPGLPPKTWIENPKNQKGECRSRNLYRRNQRESGE